MTRARSVADAERSDVFFYGLYMDPEVLAVRGVVPRQPRLAWLADRQVVLGAKAMLLRAAGECAFGVVYRLGPDEVRALYHDVPGYLPESVRVRLLAEPGSPSIAAVTMVHAAPPLQGREDPDYAARWRLLVRRLCRLDAPVAH